MLIDPIYTGRNMKIWKESIKLQQTEPFYVVTATKDNYVVFRGSQQEAYAFIEKYPYGITPKEAKELARM